MTRENSCKTTASKKAIYFDNCQHEILTPNPRVMKGIHLPGPTILHNRLETMSVTDRSLRYRVCRLLGRDFKQDIRNVETGEEDVVIVALESQIFFKACQLSISNICALSVSLSREQHVSIVVGLHFSCYCKIALNEGSTATHIDEAEKIQDGDCRDDIVINLPDQLGFLHRIECDERSTLIVESRYHRQHESYEGAGSPGARVTFRKTMHTESRQEHVKEVRTHVLISSKVTTSG